MSEIYQKIKFNADRLNSLLSKKNVVERFYKSCVWTAKTTGEITLYGVGKGEDGAFLKPGSISVLQGTTYGFLSGGEFCIPTAEKYAVVSGQSYEIKLSEHDGYITDLNPIRRSYLCVFDKKITLGNLVGRRGVISNLGLPAPVGQKIAFKQIPDERNNFPLEPRDVPNGTGIGGVGAEGILKVIRIEPFGSSHITVVETIEVTKPATKGGTGFLEITYPCPERVALSADRY